MFKYVGSREFLKLVDPALIGVWLTSREDVQRWIDDTHQQADANDEVVATFIVDREHRLRVNDRRSEHVVCAGGEPVRSAGEITFEMDGDTFLRISAISNQSTGYCPSAESWSDVQTALSKTDISHPGHFTTQIIFRTCSACQNLNIVKDDYFFCLMCDSAL